MAALTNHSYTRAEMIGQFQAVLDGLNMVWLIVVSIFLFMMQVGFTFMAPGAAHAKSSSSILTNHLIIISTVSVVVTGAGVSHCCKHELCLCPILNTLRLEIEF